MSYPAKTSRKLPLLIVGLAVVIGGWAIWSVVDEGQPAPGQAYPSQGREHIPEPQVFDNYNSNPPTSGPHDPAAAPWGIYDRELPDKKLIHNLEHGGIWISYQPSIDLDTKLALGRIARQYPQTVIMTPRAKNDAPIAVAAWQKLFKLSAVDTASEAQIYDFIRKNKNKSPEPLAR